MPQGRTQHDPERFARPIAPDHVSRNAHGQTLDDAREIFRAEWQAQIARKQHQAVRTRSLVIGMRRAAASMLIAGVSLGALLGCVLGFMMGNLPALILSVFLLGAVGFIFALAPVFIILVCALAGQSYTERLQREVWEMERS